MCSLIKFSKIVEFIHELLFGLGALWLWLALEMFGIQIKNWLLFFRFLFLNLSNTSVY